MDVIWLNLCAETEFHQQNLGAVLVVEDGMIALTINALLARALRGNQTDEIPPAGMLETRENHGQNMLTQGTVSWGCG
jgi:hypothetical protein